MDHQFPQVGSEAALVWGVADGGAVVVGCSMSGGVWAYAWRWVCMGYVLAGGGGARD